MKRWIFTGIALLALSIAGGVWLSAAPTVGTLSASPAYVVINTPTQVLMTISITDASLLPNGVNLLKTDATGRTLATIGVMKDDGLNGDSQAGDKVFTIRLNVNEPLVGQVFYRASAAFKGVLQRTLSASTVLTVWDKVSEPSSGSSIGVPSGWTARFADPSGNVLYLSPANKLSNQDAEFVADIIITFYHNSNALSLRDFYESIADGGSLNWYANSKTYSDFITENRMSAVRFEHVLAMIPTTVVAVNTGHSIVQLEDIGDQHGTDGFLLSLANSIR